MYFTILKAHKKRKTILLSVLTNYYYITTTTTATLNYIKTGGAKNVGAYVDVLNNRFHVFHR